MTKKEIDREIGNYYGKFISIAKEAIYKNNRKYSPEDCVSELYIHLIKKGDNLDIYGFYGWASNWLRFNIGKSRTSINLREIKLYTFYDMEIEPEDETPGSNIDKLKEELRERSKDVKNKINKIFLEEVTGEADYSRKSIADLYGISGRAVDEVVKNIRKELNSNQ